MFYVYVLQSDRESDQIYFGQTSDLRRRLSEHNSGKDTYTKIYAPWKVVYYEAYSSRKLVMARERQLKAYGQARTALKKRLNLI